MRFAVPLTLVFLFAGEARAADVTIGVAPPTLKVRPTDAPQLASSAALKAARNELESFQIVVRGGSTGTSVAASIASSLVGPGGRTIPDANVVVYAERYYQVGVASNDEGAPGLWPDPLVPDVDTYVGEKRNAFPIAVPAGQARAIWVDVLVPIDQPPGDYAGAIRVTSAGEEIGRVPVALHVGSFTLPSTATLASAYGFSWSSAPQAHCGGAYPFCASEDEANAIRARYLRAGLEHRITLGPATFQPPFGGSRAPFEKHVLPLVQGTGSTRLPGAKLTTVQLDGGPGSFTQWLAYARDNGFADRLFYYPVDEPGGSASKWSDFVSASGALHGTDPTAQICLTTSFQDAQDHSADGAIDIFVPVLDEMFGRPGTKYAGDQRAKYDAWLGANAKRKIWLYQSCDQHGCGACGDPSPGPAYRGWPQRVIDSSGVQDRAFGWVAFQERVTGELYFAVDHQLATAWDDQCAFSGSGDGTLFYPGKPAIVGGTTDIPIESIRLKLIRDGMEDYEYLTMAAAKDAAKARAIADALFPAAYDCAKAPSDLETARDQLFALLDVASSGGGAGGAADPSAADAPSTPNATLPGLETNDGGCACTASRGGSARGWEILAALGALAAIARRRSAIIRA